MTSGIPLWFMESTTIALNCGPANFGTSMVSTSNAQPGSECHRMWVLMGILRGSFG